MRMLTVQKIMALLLAAVGAFLLFEGRNFSYYGRFGPGSGFLPIWVGALVVLFSLMLLAQSLLAARAEGADQPFLEGRGIYKRPLALAVACLLVVPAMPVFGFRLTMFVFVLGVPAILERPSWPLGLAVAAGAGFGVPEMFERLLLVPLPHSSIAALSAMGL